MVAAVLGLGHVAQAQTEIDEDIPEVENLQIVSKVTTGERTKVKIDWDPPSDQMFVSGYRVLYTSDWRPQKWVELRTDNTEATLKALWPGRTYTIVVQATTPLALDDWGLPRAISVTTPGASNAPWVVSLGDSFISGEGGRWAGNTDLLPSGRSETDTGERAYYDYEDGETIEGCHRSRMAMIHFQVAKSMNFACSGGITTSKVDSSLFGALKYWKPGVDRAQNSFDLGEFGPAVGQAELLARFADDHPVKMVVLSIGGNNFFFSDIVTSCVKKYLLSSGSLCSEDERLAVYVSETWQDKVRAEVTVAIQEVVWAMRDAGYDESEWTLVQTLYPQPIAKSDDMRYFEALGDNPFYRQTRGGCGMWDEDADWAVNTVLETVNETIVEAALEAKIWAPELRLVHMDNSNAFRGHELCNVAVARVNSLNWEDGHGVSHWRAKGAADRSEWMKEIDVSNFSDTQKNESFHPGYWGQMALRNCLRQLWNNGTIVNGGKCEPIGGLNKYGEPNMRFTFDPSLSLLN